MGCMVAVCFIQIPSEGSDIEVASSPTCLGIGQIWTLISSYQPVLVGGQVLSPFGPRSWELRCVPEPVSKDGEQSRSPETWDICFSLGGCLVPSGSSVASVSDV